MNLHHFLTVALFVGMILQNFIRPGVIVSWLHTMSDITTALSRVLSHTHYKNATIITFVSCTLKWIYLRNMCIPILCYNCWNYLTYVSELRDYNVAPTILTSLLTILCFMHLYWLALFLNIIYKGLKHGNTDDG